MPRVGAAAGGARRARAGRRRVGLALAGGGFLGAAYELGVLAALSESIDGLDLTRMDAYVGVSAGSFIAAGLANGVTPHEMVRMFVEAEDADSPLDPELLLRPAFSEWLDALAASPTVMIEAMRAGWRSIGRGPQAMLWRSIEKAGDLLPDGILDAAPAERRLRRLFQAAGRSNDFRRLDRLLRIVATDIDTGRPVEFGAAGFDDVPISRAVIASSAIPGLFAPVRIGGRYFVDGALNKTLHASVALRQGVTMLLCLNPLVPYEGESPPHERRIARSGLPTILKQTIRTAIRSRMSAGMERYGVAYPDARVVLFEPHRDDAATFSTNIFSVTGRRRLCEHAYQQTRRDLVARSAELSPVLAEHGMALNLRVLHDEGLKLVAGMPRPRPSRKRSLGAAVLRLSHALDDLERSVRIGRTSAAPARGARPVARTGRS